MGFIRQQVDRVQVLLRALQERSFGQPAVNVGTSGPHDLLAGAGTTITINYTLPAAVSRELRGATQQTGATIQPSTWYITGSTATSYSVYLYNPAAVAASVVFRYSIYSFRET